MIDFFIRDVASGITQPNLINSCLDYFQVHRFNSNDLSACYSSEIPHLGDSLLEPDPV